jgi:hypothetical protein
MPSICITDKAEVELRRLIDDVGCYEAPIFPVLMLHWQNRGVQNKRGAQGESIWQQIAPAHWSANVMPWTNGPGGELSDSTIGVRGFNVFLDDRARAADGEFVVDAVTGVLIVQLRSP